MIVIAPFPEQQSTDWIEALDKLRNPKTQEGPTPGGGPSSIQPDKGGFCGGAQPSPAGPMAPFSKAPNAAQATAAAGPKPKMANQGVLRGLAQGGKGF